MDQDGRSRVVIEAVTPQINGGRFPIKRTVGEDVTVEADVFVDGHDFLSCVLLYRSAGTQLWTQSSMKPLSNDRWRAEFTVRELGIYYYTILAWIDRFNTWLRDLDKKSAAGMDVSLEMLAGAQLVREAAERAREPEAAELRRWALMLSREDEPQRIDLAKHDELAALVVRHPDVRFATRYEKELAVVVDPARASFSAWYEMFPRSASPVPGVHGTFKDCEGRLPYVASMGFDVLYLPPVHPIGRTHRKGRNNVAAAGPDDPGSPWAIGSEEGGHESVHPALGTLDDFRHLAAQAKELGIDIALDIAFQSSPDHPYTKEHPSWYRRRPDGSVQHAENPPKKYEDIYPFDFETADWKALWEELKGVVLFWIEQGIRIFRVDNPHTKPFAFWEWLIQEVKRDHPEVIFLAEAFTRPKVMRYLAKIGFSQSYTYFAWRNTKDEIVQYMTELTRTDVREYLRPNLWPNTPDILTDYLQYGGRPAFMARLVLAATLSSSYGIYGPPFEFCLNRAREAGSEEHLDSEKYEIKHWEIENPNTLKGFVARVNRIRRQNPALHGNSSLRFHPIDNEHLVCYSKSDSGTANVVVVVVNLDPHHTHAGWMEFPLEDLGLSSQDTYQAHDLLSDVRHIWKGARNYIELDPRIVPAQILLLRRRVRTERDFEYFI